MAIRKGNWNDFLTFCIGCGKSFVGINKNELNKLMKEHWDIQNPYFDKIDGNRIPVVPKKPQGVYIVNLFFMMILQISKPSNVEWEKMWIKCTYKYNT